MPIPETERREHSRKILDVIDSHRWSQATGLEKIRPHGIGRAEWMQWIGRFDSLAADDYAEMIGLEDDDE